MVAEGLLPPFAEPTGPRVSDAVVVSTFARQEPTGYSRRLHAEANVLLVDRVEAVALRLTPRALLVRVDGTDEAATIVPVVEHALTTAGLRRLDERTLLGVPVALQLVGLRLSEWDLWGADIDAAFRALRAIAAGEWSVDH
ncbi:MAG: hypothetical protein H0U21_02935 [Acidimicrobiia bacterium]|nr:hypothetical protein [Acidimicrobiia bacterium]